MKLSSFTRVALEAAEAGGSVLRRHFNKPVKINYKGPIDPVTAADLGSEKVALGVIKQRFPEHTVLSEEDKDPRPCNENCWIVDPLDGTVNFIHHIPIFCVSVALSFRGEIVSGVVHAPMLGETYIAEKGRGAWLNGRRLRVSDIAEPLRALVITGFPYTVHANPANLSRRFANVLVKVQGIRRLGSAALDLAYVADGRAEAFWEEGLKPWDVAAGALIVQEAGGTVSDLRSGTDYLYGADILASNGRLHEPMLDIISLKKRVSRSGSGAKKKRRTR